MTLFLRKNTHHTTTCKKSYFFFKYTFFIFHYHFCFYFTSEVEGVLFFLMGSCLHKKEIPNEIILLYMDYDIAFTLEKNESWKK